VLSFPIPTFLPIKSLVPRWRTKICPALAFAPANSFIPRYFGWESLPRRVDPADFVVDIMMILTKIQEFVKTYQKYIVLVLGVILISFISFATGYLVAKDQLKGAVQVEEQYGGIQE